MEILMEMGIIFIKEIISLLLFLQYVVYISEIIPDMFESLCDW